MPGSGGLQRAGGVCNRAGCTNPPAPGRGECRAHAAPPWAGSADARRRLLPPPHVYNRLRRAIRRRARNHCERCGRAVPRGAGEVDHRRPLLAGGPTTPANLWLLCDRCAAEKTAADLAAMRSPPS